MTNRVRIIPHKAIPGCGSFEVRIPGKASQYFYWDDLSSRRLTPDMLDRATAMDRARAAARAAESGRIMFFSRLAVLFALVAFVIGVLSVLIGAAATMNLLDEVTRARYVSRSPEQIIYGGSYVIIAAVALGTLAEMSLSLRKWTA